jgi:hypothetical protein
VWDFYPDQTRVSVLADHLWSCSYLRESPLTFKYYSCHRASDGLLRREESGMGR